MIRSGAFRVAQDEVKSDVKSSSLANKDSIERFNLSKLNWTLIYRNDHFRKAILLQVHGFTITILITQDWPKLF